MYCGTRDQLSSPAMANFRDPQLRIQSLADGVGFEPTNRLHDCRISSPVHSTALPPILLFARLKDATIGAPEGRF